MPLSSLSGWLNDANRKHRLLRPHSRRAQRSAGPRLAPRLEALEDRTVPSGGYVFHTIDDPNAGTGTNGVQGTFPIGINASGLISGNYGDANNVTHGFLLSNGQYTTFDDPAAGTAPGQGTNAFSLNDQGQVVGFYWDTTPNLAFGGFNEHGFLLSHGQYTTLDEPNAVGTTQAPPRSMTRARSWGITWMPAPSGTASCSRTASTLLSTVPTPGPALFRVPFPKGSTPLGRSWDRT
jgi:hypothetical protein